jgi:hypothetical protein
MTVRTNSSIHFYSDAFEVFSHPDFDDDEFAQRRFSTLRDFNTSFAEPSFKAAKSNIRSRSPVRSKDIPSSLTDAYDWDTVFDRDREQLVDSVLLIAESSLESGRPPPMVEKKVKKTKDKGTKKKKK